MIDINRWMDRIAAVLTAVLFELFLRFINFDGGGIVFIVLSVSILLLKTKGRFEFRLEPFYICYVTMLVFSAFSSLWAWNSGITMSITRYMLRSFLYYVLIFTAFSNDSNSASLMSCFKWAGYMETLFQIRYYGWSGLLSVLSEAKRIENGATGNVNGIGMAIAFSCVYELIELGQKKRLTVSSVMLLPSFLVIAATQSRKAFLIVGIGFIGVAICYFIDWKDISKVFLGLVVFGLVIVAVLNFMKNSSLLTGMYQRVITLLDLFKEEEDMASSLIKRHHMIEWGWEQFLKTPLLGIGIENGQEVVYQKTNGLILCYLHNNFIELLCDGGIVGFLIYYSRYFFLFYILYKYKDSNNKHIDYYPCLIISILRFIIDYGLVSYYPRTSQIYFIILFLQAANIEKNRSDTAACLPVSNRIAVSQYLYIK